MHECLLSLDMRPNPPPNDALNGTGADPVCLRHRCLCGEPMLPQIANDADCDWVKFTRPFRAAITWPSLSKPVLCIVLLRTKKEMLFANARRIVAVMQDVLSLGNRTVDHLPVDTAGVGLLMPVLSLGDPIPLLVSSADPLPAGAQFGTVRRNGSILVYFVPESLWPWLLCPLMAAFQTAVKAGSILCCLGWLQRKRAIAHLTDSLDAVRSLLHFWGSRAIGIDVSPDAPQDNSADSSLCNTKPSGQRFLADVANGIGAANLTHDIDSDLAVLVRLTVRLGRWIAGAAGDGTVKAAALGEYGGVSLKGPAAGGARPLDASERPPHLALGRVRIILHLKNHLSDAAPRAVHAAARHLPTTSLDGFLPASVPIVPVTFLPGRRPSSRPAGGSLFSGAIHAKN